MMMYQTGAPAGPTEIETVERFRNRIPKLSIGTLHAILGTLQELFDECHARANADTMQNVMRAKVRDATAESFSPQMYTLLTRRAIKQHAYDRSSNPSDAAQNAKDIFDRIEIVKSELKQRNGEEGTTNGTQLTCPSS